MMHHETCVVADVVRFEGELTSFKKMDATTKALIDTQAAVIHGKK